MSAPFCVNRTPYTRTAVDAQGKVFQELILASVGNVGTEGHLEGIPVIIYREGDRGDKAYVRREGWGYIRMRIHFSYGLS
jgi:hypothetical protein